MVYVKLGVTNTSPLVGCTGNQFLKMEVDCDECHGDLSGGWTNGGQTGEWDFLSRQWEAGEFPARVLGREPILVRLVVVGWHSFGTLGLFWNVCDFLSQQWEGGEFPAEREGAQLSSSWLSLGGAPRCGEQGGRQSTHQSSADRPDGTIRTDVGHCEVGPTLR